MVHVSSVHKSWKKVDYARLVYTGQEAESPMKSWTVAEGLILKGLLRLHLTTSVLEMAAS